MQIKKTQRQRKAGGLVRVLLDKEWTEWLPIYAWAIEHPEGIIIVDTGETARTSDPDYFPAWHPYYRSSVRLDVTPEQEIGPQLHKLGFDPSDIHTVVLTHFHTDHAGGLHHFSRNRILVSENDYRMAKGLSGKLQGYLPHRWPEEFVPVPIPLEPSAAGPFSHSYSITRAGDVLVVSTPGHTPGHLSVIVKTDGLSFFLAGDTSYTENLLLAREPDGVSPNRKTAVRTIDQILEYARTEPTVYLPSHDPETIERLNNKQTIPQPAGG